MADSYRGTTAEQDTRFGDKLKKLKRSMQFPPEFSQKVDSRKVELSVFRPWIASKVTSLLGFEDEVVIEYAAGLLEDTSTSVLDPKAMQINLTGFLESKAPEFMLALWNLLLSAQEHPLGVPQEFVEQKKLEMQKKQEEQSRAVERRNDEMSNIKQDQERMDEIRRRERGDRPSRGRGRGRGGFRPPNERDSGYGHRGRDRRDDRERYDRGPPRRRSPSPEERRRASRRSPSRSLSRSPPPRSRRSARDASPDDRSRSPSPRPRRRFDSRSPPRRRRDYPIDPSSSPKRRRSDDSPRRSRRYQDESPPPRRRRSPSPEHNRRRRRSYSRSASPPSRPAAEVSHRRERSVTPKYSADGRPIDVDTDAGPDDAVRAEGFSIKGSAQLQERMLREKAELARRSRDD